MANLEEVFQVSGVPSYTFVEPAHYGKLRLSFRTAGRCAVIEGPSGIGKTTSAKKILTEQGQLDSVLFLSARKRADIEYIEALPEMVSIGKVIVDDFHRLDDSLKQKLADFMKYLADEGGDESKLILIGINKAGDRLVSFGTDIGLRIDVFKMESNPPEKIEELIEKGAQALNITVPNRENFVRNAHGSFQIAQILCRTLCTMEDIYETCTSKRLLITPIEAVIDSVMVDFRRMFNRQCIEFARGSKLKRGGRAPYLHILRWLADSDEWSIDLRQAVRLRPDHRGSVGQVVEKDYLAQIINDDQKALGEIFHYQPENKILGVEDPRIIFYLKNLVWKNFTKEVGFSSSFFKGQYDVALSFSGEDRGIAEMLFDGLSKQELSVFYDKNEQHRILAQNVAEYLAPIYRSEATYVVVLLSKSYPKRIWTNFESDQFRGRFGENAVIPVRFTDCVEGYFSDTSRYGGLDLDPLAPIQKQVNNIVSAICRRLEEDRANSE